MWGTQILQAHKFATPALDVMCLLQHVSGMEKSAVFASYRKILEKKETARLVHLLQRRLAGEPVAYLVGEKEFYGRNFFVDRHVLIPRPETEHVVEMAIAERASRILDIGTGSGCMAISLGLAFPNAEVVGWDICPKALATARQNAQRHGCRNVTFVRRDVCADLALQEFDMVVSNPPYVLDNDPEVEKEVRDFEPRHAVFCDADGLKFYRRIAQLARQGLINTEGKVIVELHHRQGEAVREVFSDAGLGVLAQSDDLGGRLRVMAFHKHKRGV